MEIINLLDINHRSQLRKWLEKNYSTAVECWVTANRSKTPRPDAIAYLEVVE